MIIFSDPYKRFSGVDSLCHYLKSRLSASRLISHKTACKGFSAKLNKTMSTIVIFSVFLGIIQ